MSDEFRRKLKVITPCNINNVRGWGTWIRTRINGVRVRCSTVDCNGPVGTKDRQLRVYECFADFAEGNAFRCLMQRGLEALDRFAKAFGAEAESLMVDWHDEMSASFIGHLHGLFRSAVRMNPGIVSADRHDRQIDGTGCAQLC